MMNDLGFAIYWSNWEFFVAALGSTPVGISQKEYIDLMACWYGL